MPSVRRCTAAALLLSAAWPACAMPSPTWPTILSDRDKAVVAGSACGRGQVSPDDRFEARRGQRGGSGPVQVDVSCASHRAIAGRPVHRLSSCTGTAGHWTCEAPTEALDVTDGPAPTRLVAGDDADAGTGIGVLRYLLALERFRSWPIASRVAGSTCSLRTGRTGEIIIRCERGEYWVSRDCSASGLCHYRLFECNCDLPVPRGPVTHAQPRA